MVKTTINLDSEVYMMLVEEAVRKYGTTKKLSKLINEKLKGTKKRKRSIVEETAGIWKIDETGSEYVRGLRKESERRMKRLGI